MLSWFKLNTAPTLSLLKHPKFLLIALIIILAGCSLEKQSGFNRTMQNLTAHYNILFNAKEILRLKQESYATSFVDNYNEILSVYQDTAAQGPVADKDLEEAIAKANKIISIKEQSHYLGDAYLILGKAYFLEGNYFNASEYFDYVVRSYPKRVDLTQEALTWKARSAMYLNLLPDAKIALDSAIKNINPKKKPPADIFATKLQYDINTQDYADAETMAKGAVKYANNKIQRLRWTFILAQVQEQNKETAAAFANYTKIANSNAVFEMAFNASLDRIRIQDTEKGIKPTRQQRLLALLKDPNNKEFKDQIYYQVAELYLVNKDIDNAVKYYNLSIRSSVRNQNQKGLSYLRLAQINFKNKANYINAKKYYDSTLTSLVTNYPGYKAIQKTSDNLQLLADRMQIITREDTLQSLAKMDEKTRSKVIDKMVSDRVLQQQAAINSTLTNANNSPGFVSGSVSGSSFYFYNANAVGQGYSDFKTKWGNRKLEDNWRRSSRDNSDLTNNQAVITSGDPFAPGGVNLVGKNTSTGGSYRQELVQGLPLTPTLLAQSNLRIYNAYIDIAGFYRDILRDTTEAIATYELILKRFPDDPNKAPIYYSLYRLYSGVDMAKADKYKNIILKDYAQTPFAKIIIDPDFAKKADSKDAAFTNAYNQVFDLYEHKEYKDVIQCVPELIKLYPNNKYTAQLYYLKALAEGHYESVNPFRDSLQAIATRFPTDKLITPLVYQHLAYMSANNADIMNLKIVLAGDDPQDLPFTLDNALKEKTAYRHPSSPYYLIQQPQERITEKKEPAKVPPAAPAQAATVAQPVKQTVTSALSIFSMKDSTNYYFVVNVSTGTTNLSSSRFGIGQFNRVNYTGRGIKHQLMAIGADNQLIYVGRFTSLDAAKIYARNIIPILPDIMKVPQDKYSFFIITQENLNKLADKKTLDSYVDYYQINY